MTASDVLFQMPGAVATRESEGRVVIRSAPKHGYALLFLVIAAVFTPFPIAFVALIATEVGKGNGFNPLAVVCLAPFLFLLLVMVILAIMATAVFAFPRRCEIDLAQGIARVDHVPGFSRKVALSELSSVDIVLVTDRGGHGCFLGVSIRGSRRMLWIHTFGSRRGSLAEARDRMLPLAEFVARQLKLPVECSRGVASWLTTVKGERLDLLLPMLD
jgi:hypothetical protein